jgi:hypothetical protein
MGVLAKAQGKRKLADKARVRRIWTQIRIDFFLQQWANRDMDIRGSHYVPGAKAASELPEPLRKRVETLQAFYRNFSDLVPRHGGEFEGRARPLTLQDVVLRRVHGPRIHRGQPRWEARSHPAFFLLEARDRLRKAWLEPSVWRKREQLLLIYGAYIQSGAELKEDGFLRAMVRAIENAQHLRVCQNPDGCPKPYFVARRSSDRGCGRPECTAALRRHYKLQWWNEVGVKVRQERARKKRRRSKSKPRKGKKS